jgi:hypothetical protein
MSIQGFKPLSFALFFINIFGIIILITGTLFFLNEVYLSINYKIKDFDRINSSYKIQRTCRRK